MKCPSSLHEAAFLGWPGTSLSNYLDLNMQIYQENVKRRNLWLKEAYGGDLSKMIPFDERQQSHLWDFFPPAYNCPLRERLGRFSDGGKVVCNWHVLALGCGEEGASGSPIVYSFGIRNEVSFEKELADITGCPIWAFDPSVATSPQVIQGMHFERAGLGSNNTSKMKGGPLRTLGTIMQANNHDKIDLLKIDCDGCEWEAFKEMRVAGTLLKIDQILIELHFSQHTTNNPGNDSGVHEVFAFFEACEEAGLYPFSWEVNHLPSGNRGQKPWAIEYSLVRPSSAFMSTFHEYD